MDPVAFVKCERCGALSGTRRSLCDACAHEVGRPHYSDAEIAAAELEDRIARQRAALAASFTAAAEQQANPPAWEANPLGLSGRLIRGYRHWRNKR